MTSSAVTSTMMPRERWRVTWLITSSRSCRTSVSVSAAWIDAIRNGPCLRMGTAIAAPRSAGLVGDVDAAERDLVAEQALGLLDAALEVAHRVDLAELDAQRHQR